MTKIYNKPKYKLVIHHMQDGTFNIQGYINHASNNELVNHFAIDGANLFFESLKSLTDYLNKNYK